MILVWIILYIIFITFIAFTINLDLLWFNPIQNYKDWTQLNWFGIIVITILLNIIFFPYAIGYWIYKLFTVGRK
jgi:hypothetical protein